jgi:hypothetical protein
VKDLTTFYPGKALPLLMSQWQRLESLGLDQKQYDQYFFPLDGLCLFRCFHKWIETKASKWLTQYPLPEHLLVACVQQLYEWKIQSVSDKKPVDDQLASFIESCCERICEENIPSLKLFVDSPSTACALYMAEGWTEWDFCDLLLHTCAVLLQNEVRVYAVEADVTGVKKKKKNYSKTQDNPNMFPNTTPLHIVMINNNHYMLALQKDISSTLTSAPESNNNSNAQVKEQKVVDVFI